MKANLINNTERKQVVNLAKKRGLETKYLGAPSMAYQIGGAKLNKDGSFGGDLESIYDFLLEIESLEWAEFEGHETDPDYQIPDGQADAAVNGNADTLAQTLEATEPETIDHDTIEDIEAATFLAEGEIEEATNQALEEERPEELTRSRIGIRTNFWGAEQRRNLIFTLHSKGHLISKALNGEFWADKDWCEAHKKDNDLTVTQVNEAVEAGLIKGIWLEGDTVWFDGFADAEDTILRSLLLSKLIEYLSDNKHQRVQIKEDNSDNEKYSFRCWITRLGWTEQDADSKAARKLFYSRLNGHVAFRTDADKAKWEAARVARKAVQTA